MIHESNNDAASAVLDRVGLGAIARVAREAGMRDYAPGVGWWAYTQTSAADQARFFIALPQLIPRQFWPYARGSDGRHRARAELGHSRKSRGRAGRSSSRPARCPRRGCSTRPRGWSAQA